MEDFRLFFLVVADRSFSMFLLPLVRLMIEVSKKIPENGDAVIVPKKNVVEKAMDEIEDDTQDLINRMMDK